MNERIVAAAAIQDVVAGATVHRVVRLDPEEGGVGAVGDVVTGRPVEGPVERRASEGVADDAGGRREQLFRISRAVGEAHPQPQHVPDLGLAGRVVERAGGVAGDVRPGLAVIARLLPAQREGPKTVGVLDRGDQRAERLALRRRDEPVRRRRVRDDRRPGRDGVHGDLLDVLELGDDDPVAHDHGLRVVTERQVRELRPGLGQRELLDGTGPVHDPEAVRAGAAIDEVAAVAGPPQDVVVAGSREDEVVARAAAERVVAGRPDHDVDGRRAVGDQRVGREVVAHLDLLDRGERIDAVALRSEVVADDDLALRVPLEAVGRNRSRVDGGVGAGAAYQTVVAVPSGELVVVVAAVERVVAGPADQGVGAVVAEEGVVALAAIDPVVAAAGVDGIVADIALDVVVAVAPQDDVRARGTRDVLGGGGSDEGGLDGGRLLQAGIAGDRAGPVRDHPDLDARRSGRREEGAPVRDLAVRARHVAPLPVVGQHLPLQGHRPSGRVHTVHQRRDECRGIVAVRVERSDGEAVEGLVENQRDVRRAVRETQLLDVAQRIRAVIDGGIGQRSVGDGERAVRRAGDRVVRPDVVEHGGVHVRRRRSGGDHLADDCELGRADHPVDHQLEERLSGPATRLIGGAVVEDVLQAVGRRHLLAGIRRIADADAHVQPAVAVEDVVAAVALERIAARAAQQDVAGLEELLSGSKRHDLVEPRDPGDAGRIEPVVEEHALVCRRDRRAGRRLGIRVGSRGPVVADERIVQPPAGEPLRLVEAVA